jgi:hypothetical protein
MIYTGRSELKYRPKGHKKLGYPRKKWPDYEAGTDSTVYSMKYRKRTLQH